MRTEEARSYASLSGLILSALVAVQRASVRKIIEDIGATKCGNVYTHIRALKELQLIEEAGRLHDHPRQPMTYRIHPRLRGQA